MAHKTARPHRRLTKQAGSAYDATPDPQVVVVEKARFLSCAGTGAPGGSAFQAAVAALYGTAWTIKMTRKRGNRGDFKVGALEGLWGTAAGGADWKSAPLDTWRWNLLIRVPGDVRDAELRAAAKALEKKGRIAAGVHLEDIDEGRCIQALHVGPYATEPTTIDRMEKAARAAGFAFQGAHHEIYLGDPRRAKPERLETILRHPVVPAHV